MTVPKLDDAKFYLAMGKIAKLRLEEEPTHSNLLRTEAAFARYMIAVSDAIESFTPMDQFVLKPDPFAAIKNAVASGDDTALASAVGNYIREHTPVGQQAFGGISPADKLCSQSLYGECDVPHDTMQPGLAPIPIPGDPAPTHNNQGWYLGPFTERPAVLKDFGPQTAVQIIGGSPLRTVVIAISSVYWPEVKRWRIAPYNGHVWNECGTDGLIPKCLNATDNVMVMSKHGGKARDEAHHVDWRNVRWWLLCMRFGWEIPA